MWQVSDRSPARRRWRIIVAAGPAYQDYQDYQLRTTRDIPVVIVEAQRALGRARGPAER